MSDPSETGLVERFSMFSSTAAACSTVIGLSVLVGWTLRISILLTWGEATTMAPNAAACSILAGISLWLLRKKDAQRLARIGKIVAKTAAGIVGLVGALTLVEQLFGLDLGIDAVFVVKAYALEIAGARIRMSPIAAVIFVLLGLALSLIDWRTNREDWPAQFLSFGAAMGAAFGLLGLVFGPAVSPITLALPAVVTYFGMALGIVCARAPWAIGGLLTRETQGARLLRRMVPTGLLVLSLIGWLISKPLLTDSHFTWTEVSALAVLCSAILTSFIAWTALIVDRGDTERKKLEQALHLSNGQMSPLLDRIGEPQSEPKLRTKANVGFGLAIILTCLLSLLSWRMAQQATDESDWVAHTHEVSTALEAMLRHLVDVETGGRGFALTGRAPFLEPYETGKSAAVKDLHRLRQLVADNFEQTRRLNALEKQANRRIESAGNVVATRQKTGQSPTEAELERGKQHMDAVRATIAEMEDAEERLLEQRSESARAAQHLNLSLIGLGALMGAIFLSLAGFTVSREIGISARSRAQVISLNADLERRVEQRTAALQSEVTVRKLAEEELKKQAALLHLAHDAILVRNLQSQVVFWSYGAESLYGWSSEEASGRITHELLQTKFPLPLAEIEAALISKGDWEGELRHATRDGAEVVVASRWSLQRNQSGAPTAILEINRDITDSKQAEIALGESEGRLAGVIQSAMDSIITTDEAQRILVFNTAAEKMFRCPAAEALGQPVTRFIPQRYHAAHPRHIRKFGENGVSARAMGALGKLWAVRANGEEFQIEASISHIEAAGKKLFTVILRDITERVQAEEIREHLAAVVDSSDDAIISKDLNGIINAWNRGAEKIFGYPAAEIMGRPMLMLFPPERANEETDILARIRRGESVEHFETVRVCKDGKKIDVSVTISPVRDSSGTIVGASKIARDITERKRTEQALRESENRFRTLIEQASDAFFLHDGEGRFLEVNRQACESLGYTREELLRMRVFDVEQEVDIRKAQQAWERAESGKAYTIQGRQRRKDGTAFPVEVRLSAYYVDGQKLHLGLARDTTERERAQDALRQSDVRRGFALDTAKIGDWDLDLTTLQATRSSLHDQIFGYSTPLPEWNFDIFLRHVHPDDRERVRETFQSNVSQKKKSEFECRIIHPNGDIRWIWACGDQVRDSSGAVTRMFGIVQDITERKQSEEVLRESEERFRLFIEHAPAALAMFDREMRYLHLSRRWRSDYRMGERDMRGVSHYKMFPEMPERWKEVHRRALAGEVLRDENDHFERADGSVKWLRWEVRPWRDGAGTIAGILAFTEDITERKLADDTFHDSQEKLRLALDGARLGTWNWDLKTGELVGSPLAFAMFGLPADTKFDFEIFLATLHPDDRTMVNDAMNRTLVEHVEYDVEYRCVWPDGTERWIAAKGRAYHNDAGENIRVGGIVFDVTDRRRALERLRESEERFQAMANGIPQLAWMAEADGHIFWYNQRWYDYTDTTFEQMEGWGWQSVHDPEVLPMVLERWNGSISRGEPFDMELPLRGADGRFRMFLTRVMPLLDSEGCVTRWFGTNTDISEQKESQRQLAEQGQELARQAGELAKSGQALETQTIILQSVLDSIDEGLVAADENGKFILWNPAATRIVGMGAENVAPGQWNTHYGVYLPDKSTPLPDEQNPLRRALHGEVSAVEIFLRNPELEEGVWLEISGGPLKGKDGSSRGGVVAFRDITSKKAAELEIRKLNESLEERIAKRTEQLETANRELESFTYSVSHDLRAPLRHIMGFAGACLEEFGATLDPQALHYVQRIQDGTRRMGLLTDELLNLARTGQRSLRLQVTGLNAVVDEIILMLKAETEGREVEWKVGKLPSVECDPILVRQIFQNLLSNAIKYSRPRPHAIIEVGHTQQNDRPVIFVRDNGVGFNMQYADKLFGVFQRLHRDEDFEGTGVGLATVYRIVQKHGGRIWAESEVDHGATFYFTLSSSERAGSRGDAATAGA